MSEETSQTESGKSLSYNQTDAQITKADPAWPVLNLEPGDLESYLSINDSIHVFEWTVLRFYAAAKSVEQRTVRAAAVSEALTGLKKSLIGDGCPDGYTATPDGRCIRNSGG
jgi:hypothetical protein